MHFYVQVRPLKRPSPEQTNRHAWATLLTQGSASLSSNRVTIMVRSHGRSVEMTSYAIRGPPETVLFETPAAAVQRNNSVGVGRIEPLG